MPSERAKGAPAVIGGGGTRIMLVDDEAMVAGMAAEVLEDLGYTVTVFLDPGAALSSYRADPFGYDLVITDLTMPTMSGLTMATAIWQLRPALPIIVSTGYTRGFAAKEAGELGFAAFLAKPYEIDRLGAAVASALGATQATV